MSAGCVAAPASCVPVGKPLRGVVFPDSQCASQPFALGRRTEPQHTRGVRMRPKTCELPAELDYTRFACRLACPLTRAQLVIGHVFRALVTLCTRFGSPQSRLCKATSRISGEVKKNNAKGPRSYHELLKEKTTKQINIHPP